MTLKMTTAQVVETSVTVTNSSFQNYTHPDDHTRQTTVQLIVLLFSFQCIKLSFGTLSTNKSNTQYLLCWGIPCTLQHSTGWCYSSFTIWESLQHFLTYVEQCAVPYSPMEVFFYLYPLPLGNSSWATYVYFASKILAFKIPPLGISNDLSWGGYGFFLELHNVYYCTFCITCELWSSRLNQRHAFHCRQSL